MSETQGSKHEEIEAEFSDLYEGSLPVERARELHEHLAGCERCRTEYERFRQALDALSGLHKLAPEHDLGERVTRTIHRRSAGAFFGKRAFGDRVPVAPLALLVLLVALAVLFLARWSTTGSVHESLRPAPTSAPAPAGARGLVPRP